MYGYWKKCVIVASLVAASASAYAQDVQWASSVISFSSQLGEKEYSAKQVLGKPNKCPAYGDSPCAWVGKNDGLSGGGEERLKVGYDKPMRIQQVAIAENANPGAVQQVIVYDQEDVPHRVYYAEPGAVNARSRVLNVFFKETSFKVTAVELVLQCGKVPGYNEIDAIGISASKEPVKAVINLAPDSKIIGSRENLGYGVNSPYDEVFPVISPDGHTLYFDRKDHPANYGYADNVWYSTLMANGKWGQAVNPGAPINSGRGSYLASITPDGTMALLGGAYPKSKGSYDVEAGIWTSTRTKNGWAPPVKLQIDSFYTRHRFMEFCLANDGKTILASLQRSDSYGVRDIYVCFRRDDGTWTAPKNLGPVVNSAADEGMPFLASDGKTLYFSSDGFAGYGQVDMYLTRRLDDTWEHWSEPQNLGPDFNTPEWDAYYTVPASGDYAYFVSNKGAVGALDIFRAKLPESLKPNPVVLVSGKVIDSKTGKPVQAEIRYEILPGGKDAGIAHTDPTTGAYKIVLPAGKMYGFRAESKGYVPVDENLDLKKIKAYQEMTRDLTLVPFETGQTVRLNNIFFDFNKSVLHEESYAELDRLVEMIKSNPAMHIEIAGHTDNVGSAEKNLRLSEDRANAVKTYLVKKGIDNKKLRVVGYGSTKPIAKNDTEDGRQQNRRVEFTILK